MNRFVARVFLTCGTNLSTIQLKFLLFSSTKENLYENRIHILYLKPQTIKIIFAYFHPRRCSIMSA